MKSILVPIDLSDATERVTQVLEAWDRAKLYLLQVVPLDAALVGDDVEPLDLPANRQPQKRQREQLAERLRACGHQVETRLEMGSTVDTILESITDMEVDLVIMGSHGHGALYDLVIGSVSEEVIRRSSVPVLIVPTRSRSIRPGNSV